MEILHSLYQQRYQSYHLDSTPSLTPFSICSSSWKGLFLPSLSRSSRSTRLSTWGTSSQLLWSATGSASSSSSSKRSTTSRRNWACRPQLWANTSSAAKNSAEIPHAPGSPRNSGNHSIPNITPMASRVPKSRLIGIPAASSRPTSTTRPPCASPLWPACSRKRQQAADLRLRSTWRTTWGLKRT